jgi:hypothetical protein
MDTWLSYASLESFLYFVYLEPTEARRMFWGMVPKTVDDYLAKLSGYWKRNPKKRPDSPIWHLYGKGGSVPEYSSKITFFLINNLISALGTGDKELAVKYLMRYDPSIQKGDVVINHLVNKGMNYYRDHLLPNKEYRVPTEKEAEMLRILTENLRNYDGDDVSIISSTLSAPDRTVSRFREQQVRRPKNYLGTSDNNLVLFRWAFNRFFLLIPIGSAGGPYVTVGHSRGLSKP